jgi:hypothetical protein
MIVVRFPLLVRVHGVHAQEVILQAVRALVLRDVAHQVSCAAGLKNLKSES